MKAIVPARGEHVRIELADPAFFAANPKRLRVEDNPGTGRTYFILKGRIVAVGRTEDQQNA